MGAQQVLRAAAAGILIAASTWAAPAPAPVLPHTLAHAPHERVAVIDLGPPGDGSARRQLAAAVVAAGMEPVAGDGVDDALAGTTHDRDEVPLAAAMADAGRAFGALDCTGATT